MFFKNIKYTVHVATVLTACGIETMRKRNLLTFFVVLVATVLTACGIETTQTRSLSGSYMSFLWVATVLTACGIETLR